MGFALRRAAGALGRFVQGAVYLMGFALRRAAGAFLLFLGLLLGVLGIFGIFRVFRVLRVLRVFRGLRWILRVLRILRGLRRILRVFRILGILRVLRGLRRVLRILRGLRPAGFAAGGSGLIFILRRGLISGGTGFRLGFAVICRRALGLVRIRCGDSSGRGGPRRRAAGILTVGYGQRTGEHHGDHQCEADDSCQ